MRTTERREGPGYRAGFVVARLRRLLVPSSWLRLPRRSARLRLTLLYGGLFVGTGAALLAATYLLVNSGRSRPIFFVTSSGQEVHITVGSGTIVGPTPRAPLSANQVGFERAVVAAHSTVLHQLFVSSAIALGIMAIVSLAVGWLIAGRVLSPLRTITATARRISASNLHERLGLRGEDEFKQLGDTLDDLFRRLEAAFEAQRRFVANASHELRTPLTADRAMLQVALANPDATVDDWRATGGELLASSQEQADLMEALLTLATSEGGIDRTEEVDLAAAVTDALAAPRPEVADLGLSVVARTETVPPIHGDPLLVERLVSNLVDNAVHYNVPGGRVEVATTPSDGCAAVTVANSGPVVPPSELDRLFQPFQRLDPDRVHRDGHGLGLSIVRAVAAAHGARIVARANPDGGLRVVVTFPAAGDTRGGERRG